MLKSQRNIFGFTVIELLVTIGILMVIATLSVVNFRGVSDSSNIDAARAQVLTDIRNLQNYGFTGKNFSLCGTTAFCDPSVFCGGGCSLGIPAGGFGISFDSASNPNQYIIFGDFDGDKAYDGGEQFVDGVIALPSGVWILDQRTFDFGDRATPLPEGAGIDIVFEINNGSIIANGSNTRVASVLFRDTDGGTFELIVNSITGNITWQ